LRADDQRAASQKERSVPESGGFLSVLTGSFATPAAENPTVAMVEAAYRHHALDARYINCDVAPADLGDAVRGARAMGWAGFNCSIPHKGAVTEHLDQIAPSAQIIGAVNCVVIRGDQLVGENTDGQGFVGALRTVADPSGQVVTIFGAGGAARAIAVETALAGAASITIVNRNPDRGQALAELINEWTPAHAQFVAWQGQYQLSDATTIAINATSVGLYPRIEDRLDIDVESLQQHMIVADVIPNPPRTQLLRDAERRGCVTLDGLGMLVNQGIIGVELWTGISPDRRVMERTLEELFIGAREVPSARRE
jgi:shikimate dehydrogenase